MLLKIQTIQNTLVVTDSSEHMAQGEVFMRELDLADKQVSWFEDNLDEWALIEEGDPRLPELQKAYEKLIAQ